MHVLLQEGALRFLCPTGQFSLEVANQSLSLCEEQVGEAVVGWGHAKFARNTHCVSRSPQLLRTQCKYGQPHSSQDSLPQRMPKHSDDLVPAAGTALRFSETAAFKNEVAETERGQGLQGGKNPFQVSEKRGEG